MQNMQADKGIALDDRKIASQDRATQSQAITSLGSTYTSGIGNTLQNDKIPSATRSQAQGDMAQLYRDQLAKVAQLYGSPSLTWGAPAGVAPASPMTTGV
jgi:hypothetical protein